MRMVMHKVFKFMVVVAMLVIVGCGSWTAVPVQLNPAAVKDPVKEIDAVLRMSGLNIVKIEVTDQYISQVFVGNVGAGTITLFIEKVANIGIVTRSNAYHVSASSASGEEIWRFRPAAEDLATCQRFLNAYYALTKRPVPTTDAPPTPSKPN